MTTRPAFPRVASSPEGQRTLAGVGDIVRQMFAPGSFLQRLLPGRLLRPVATGTPLALAWGEMNRLPPGSSIARLPQIRPEWIGVPLHVLKASSAGFAEVQPGGVGVNGVPPTVDGNAYGLWMREAGMRTMMTDGANWFTSRATGNTFQVFNILDYGAGPDMPASVNVRAILAAIRAAEAAGGGVVLFPGGSDTLYSINAQLSVVGSHIKIWAPGGAKLFLAAAFQAPASSVVFVVGDLDAGIDFAGGGSLLASDVAAGAMTITLAAGEGANFSAGQDVGLWSNSIIPRHHSAVTARRWEFVNIYSVTGDVLVVSRPLRYSYATADSAAIFAIDWIDGFEWHGLGIDGNNQIAMSTALLMSWCRDPIVKDAYFKDIQQRGVRMQGCWRAKVPLYSQSNGRSEGFQGANNLFSYATCEGGPCEAAEIRGLRIDRCRHAYTTIGMITNMGVASPLNTPGFGVPSYTVISGMHTNARGQAFDTHETGLGISFVDCVAVGSLTAGAQNRCVDTVFRNLRVRDCVGPAVQIGSDSVDCVIEGLDYARTNSGIDEAGLVDWTKQSPIYDRGVGTRIGPVCENELDNGSFELWERGSSFTVTGGTANRWKLTEGTGETVTVTQRTHAETKPYGGKYYLRFDRTGTGSGPSTLKQYTDDVRTFAGKQLAFSCELRSTATGVNFYARQDFGTGGSPSAAVETTAQVRTVDGTWAKYNGRIDVPDLTGKTIGSNEDSSFQLVIELPIAHGNTRFDIDCAKLEISPVPTDFTQKPLAADAEACRRWFEKSYNDGQAPGSTSSGGNVFASSSYATGSSAQAWGRMVDFTVRKGRFPTVTLYAPDTGASGMIRNLTSGATGTNIQSTVLPGYQNFYARPTNSGDVIANDVTAFSWVAHVPDFE